MNEIILTVRLCFKDTKKNKNLFNKLVEWLNQGYQPTYQECAVDFVNNILQSAKLPLDRDFELTTRITHSASDNPLGYSHPKLIKVDKWHLDDLLLKDKSNIWIRLENQWIKGVVEVKNKNSYILILPENVLIPISENLFLSWL